MRLFSEEKNKVVSERSLHSQKLKNQQAVFALRTKGLKREPG
jgi:hypothetical protein